MRAVITQALHSGGARCLVLDLRCFVVGGRIGTPYTIRAARDAQLERKVTTLPKFDHALLTAVKSPKDCVDIHRADREPKVTQPRDGTSELGDRDQATIVLIIALECPL